MKDLVNLAFDKLGYPHEDENPDDIDHIIEYLSAPDTHTAQGVLDAYPVLFRDPVVMQVVALVRQYLISPPEELRTRRAPTMPPDPSLPSSLPNPSSPASPDSPYSSDSSPYSSPASEPSPIFGIPTSPNSPASALTDDKLFTILTSIVDGSLTSMGYDYKTHTPIIQTPTVGERMQAMKLLLEINASRGAQSGPQINILNNIPAPTSATPASASTPLSTPSSTAPDTPAPQAVYITPNTHDTPNTSQTQEGDD